MKRRLFLFLSILPILLIFVGCNSTKEASSNIIKLTQSDEENIREYLDTKADDISSPFQGGKMYSAFKILGTNGDKIYLWMLKYEYLKPSNELTNGVSLPVVLTIGTNDGQIVIENYSFPKDGNDYGPSLIKLFPQNVRDQISLNHNELVKELEQILENRIHSE